MADAHSDLEALAARLHGAAARLKAAGGTASEPPGEDGGAVDGLARVRSELEAAGTAVREAREGLDAVEAWLTAA